MKSTDLRPGLAIKMDSRLYLITKVEHRTPGNLRAFVQVLLRDLNSGALIDKRLRSGEEVEQVDLDRRPMEYLFFSHPSFYFSGLEKDLFQEVQNRRSDILGWDRFSQGAHLE